MTILTYFVHYHCWKKTATVADAHLSDDVTIHGRLPLNHMAGICRSDNTP